MPLPTAGEIAGNIGRSPTNRQKMAIVNHGGKPALTRYRVRKAFGEAAALVECRLATGRTHQIRVHMAEAGHPLIGDPVYGRVSAARRRALPAAIRDEVCGFSRQALHAYLIGFVHPRTHEWHSYESPLAHDINALISMLEVI